MGVDRQAAAKILIIAPAPTHPAVLRGDFQLAGAPKSPALKVLAETGRVNAETANAQAAKSKAKKARH